MHHGLVALSASAVAAIYMAGYMRTQAADASIGAAALPTVTTGNSAPVAAAAPAVTPTPFVIQRPTAPPSRPAPTTTVRTQPSIPQPTSPPTPVAAAGAAQTQSALKDGTFTGQGTSRRGDVWVSVDIQAGKITNVTITRSTLQYPLRDIANLPSQVVQRQSAQVDIVTRATYSSTAFRSAVSQALASAQAG
jgi:uncharacterized protein with FMN-binding domain